MNLGKSPWLGLPDNPHTACGCYPPKKEKQMRLPTKDEKIKAILDARKDVFEFLQSIGKTNAFDDFSRDEMCGLIRAAQDGVQRSLHEQVGSAFEDEIPF